EKAAEMGAARILPVVTEFTNSERVNVERLQAHAVEAAEQCGGTFVPPVAAPQKLSTALDAWPAERRIMFADEALAGGSSGPSPLFAAGADEAPMGRRGGPWAILIGPEGGFSSAERARLHKMPEAHPVALGPRILRADTAAVAALTLWQSALGDW
ncbi:MAG: 16S rRNA (uracil(1498)-N(3))-methyltransferase, partial [Maritimibacter sp.]|nr:16S rRNA (uracil(1498)-N(3))-methyltransferase [Maritimibacter sp.]